MTTEEFITKAKEIVRQYTIEHTNETDFVVSVVWESYILGNQKALISTSAPDCMYYEITYNALKDEIYFDAYKKFENRKIDI